MGRKETGNRGEQLAQQFLKKQGYRIRVTNYTCPYGEIDIVSEKKKTLVFTEVRTKTGSGFGTPEESITRKKREHLRNTAYHYLQTHDKQPDSWRIDLVAVELDANGDVLRIDLIENAVGEE